MSSSAARCGDRRDRVPPAFLVHQRRHRRAHLTRRHPVQVQPRNRRVETRTAANVRRYQRRAKRHRRPRAAAELRPPPRRSRQDLPARKVTVANHPLPPVRQLFVREPRQALLELRRHGSLDQPSRARAQQLRQRVLNHRWRQFKTLKYHPGFPGRFHDITAAITFCRTFFPWYNTEHRHSGIAMLTPDDVHHHRTQSVLDQRGQTLQAAWTRHPERFVRGIPKPDPLPEAVWINPPVTSTTGDTTQ